MTQIKTPHATATVIRRCCGPHNETLTWRIETSEGSMRHVQSSRIFAPAETLVFLEGSSIEIAGGHGESHESAMRQYLAAVAVRCGERLEREIKAAHWSRLRYRVGVALNVTTDRSCQTLSISGEDEFEAWCCAADQYENGPVRGSSRGEQLFHCAVDAGVAHGEWDSAKLADQDFFERLAFHLSPKIK